jgi:hypothetical protein
LLLPSFVTLSLWQKQKSSKANIKKADFLKYSFKQKHWGNAMNGNRTAEQRMFVAVLRKERFRGELEIQHLLTELNDK